MSQYLLAFLLINSYYQSLGNPIQPTLLISESLSLLSHQCENTFLSIAIQDKVHDCALAVAPPYNIKQIRCLMYLDINRQLCGAVDGSKVILADDFMKKVEAKQDIIDVCGLAKEWAFTNLTDYPHYKDTEKLIKSPVTCGEICGVEDTLNEANQVCKYYKQGIDLLKVQVTTTAHNDIVPGGDSVIAEPESSKDDIAVNGNSEPLNSHTENTKTLPVQIKQTEPAQTVPEKTVGQSSVAQKSTVESVQTTSSKKTLVPDNTLTDDKNNADMSFNSNPLEEPIDMHDLETADQGNKSIVTAEIKPGVENEAALPDTGKDVPVLDTKDIVLEKTEQKVPGDGDDYADSEGNDGGDDDSDDGMEIKSEGKQDFIRTNILPVNNADIAQKEYYPNTMSDGFSDDGDHFFPFFLSAIIMVVLLYVLYHNKSKVSKVFFGLILEGRQGSRRRNSRGHAYRRLDTLEQAMSANTAAPPSKIIY